MGYSTGADQSTIFVVLTVYFNRPPSLWTTKVSVNTITENSVVVEYSVQDGAPMQHHWMGLWRGQFDPYVAPSHRQDVYGLSGRGLQEFENVSIESGATYTVGYFVDREVSNLAATVTFEG